MKTSELQRAALDWAVAIALGHDKQDIITDFGVYIRIKTQPAGTLTFCPSTDWAQGGPIIEREKIGVWWATPCVDDDGVEYGNHWYAGMECTDDNADKPYRVAIGPTPLIAAMRCYVVNKLGDEIELPEELK